MILSTYHNRDLMSNGQDLRSIDNLFLEIRSREVEYVGYDGVHNKIVVRTKFCA